jgi:precorrin-2/cobalt-factor-2 C20-methyltransferase
VVTADVRHRLVPYVYPTSVRKTSVYLPDALKGELGELADRTGRSEAELIRLAIERLVRAGNDTPVVVAPAGRPVPPPVAPGPRLVGVGVGPSDPDLVTERALAVLRAADRVLAPATASDAIGRAEAVVRSAAPDVGVDRLVIDIGVGDGARATSLDRAAATLVGHLDRGELVAVALLGDPNVWSVFSRLARAVAGLRPGVPVETVPGIMAFQELAARSSTVVADGDEVLTVVTLGDDTDRLDALLDDAGRSLVVYKGGRHLPELAAALERHGRLGPAVVGEMLGLPGGRTAAVSSAADRPASYLATVIAPPVRAREGRERGSAR